MKNRKWLLIVLAVLFGGLLTFFIVKEIIKKEVDLTFYETISVANNTNKDVDKLIKTISQYVLEYDTIDVMVLSIPDEYRKMVSGVFGIDIRALTQKNGFINNTYIIFLAENLKPSEYKPVIAHEMAHIEQFQSGKLIPLFYDITKIVYLEDTINLVETPYKNRMYEIDAVARGNDIQIKLDKILYK